MSEIPFALFLIGIAAVVYGAWLVYPPAAFAVGGAALMLLAVRWERGRSTP